MDTLQFTRSSIQTLKKKKRHNIVLHCSKSPTKLHHQKCYHQNMYIDSLWTPGRMLHSQLSSNQYYIASDTLRQQSWIYTVGLFVANSKSSCFVCKIFILYLSKNERGMKVQQIFKETTATSEWPSHTVPEENVLGYFPQLQVIRNHTPVSAGRDHYQYVICSMFLWEPALWHMEMLPPMAPPDWSSRLSPLRTDDITQLTATRFPNGSSLQWNISSDRVTQSKPNIVRCR